MENRQNTALTETKQEGKQESASERFTQMVLASYSDGKQMTFSEHEKRLIKGYFITIDQALTAAEAERLRKNASNRDHEKYDNLLPYKWKYVNLPQLAQDLAHFARLGYDMQQDNMLFPIPYKDNKAQLYTVTLMPGYNGIRYEAEKFALVPFKAVTVEVIFSNDKFHPIKKDSKNPVEGYEFDIPQPFDRGSPVGAFGYIEYEDATKNRLVIFSKADIEKRKPKYASPEFWGGTKKTWQNGAQVEVTLEGWVAEMYEKTMKREIYGSKNIPRDPAKIDENYMYIRRREAEYADMALEAEVAQNANGAPIRLPETPEEEQGETPAAPALSAPAGAEPVQADRATASGAKDPTAEASFGSGSGPRPPEAPEDVPAEADF